MRSLSAFFASLPVQCSLGFIVSWRVPLLSAFFALGSVQCSLGFMRCRKLLILARVKFPFGTFSRFKPKREFWAKGNLKREKSPPSGPRSKKGNLKAKTGKKPTQRAQKQKREFKARTPRASKHLSPFNTLLKLFKTPMYASKLRNRSPVINKN